MTLSVLATLPLESGDLGGSVLYIDTEGAFSAKRFFIYIQFLKNYPFFFLLGLGGSILYIDTEGVFSAKRFFKYIQIFFLILSPFSGVWGSGRQRILH